MIFSICKKTIRKMAVYLIMEFHKDDGYYGYRSTLHSVYSSLEEAKNKVDNMVANARKWANNYCGLNGSPFIDIIVMEFGSIERETVYTTFGPPEEQK